MISAFGVDHGYDIAKSKHGKKRFAQGVAVGAGGTALAAGAVAGKGGLQALRTYKKITRAPGVKQAMKQLHKPEHAAKLNEGVEHLSVGFRNWAKQFEEGSVKAAKRPKPGS